MRMVKVLTTLALIAAPFGAAVQAASPGECGEYKYWKHGACHDARDAPASAWADQMAKKSTW
jgi:hypothetical protein